MSDIGFDYGAGTTNVNPATGIRYGVIHQNAISQRWGEKAEPWYGSPRCPDCGKFIGTDFRCEACTKEWDEEKCFPPEPIGWKYQDKDYLLGDCLDSDVMVLNSPFYTYAQFCSPCCPGAGSLENPRDPESGAPKTYCLSDKWFDTEKAPYRMWKVSDDTEVLKNDS